MKTFSAKPNEIDRAWFVVDLDGQKVGRAATQIASILRGKTKPIFTPHVDTGDYVVAVNAEKVVLTGNKLKTKMYYRHSEHPGALKETSAEEVLEKSPEDVIIHAVKGMLPKGPLGRSMLTKFKVYAGPQHPHTAQSPKPLEL